MKKTFRFLFLPYRKKKLLVESLLLVLGIRLSLWILPFKWLNERLLSLNSTDFENRETDWNVVKSVARSVRASSRYVPQASCLTQALATRTLLRLKGQNSWLKIGVDRDENDVFIAHAWIEVDGKIVIGRLPRHERLSVLNSSRSVAI
jgi:hypothetical protein